MAKVILVAEILVVSTALLLPVRAQEIDPSVGWHLAETVCSECHQHAPDASPKNPQFGRRVSWILAACPPPTELRSKSFAHVAPDDAKHYAEFGRDRFCRRVYYEPWKEID